VITNKPALLTKQIDYNAENHTPNVTVVYKEAIAYLKIATCFQYIPYQKIGYFLPTRVITESTFGFGSGRVAQEYFGLSRAIYLQRKSYLYSHATHGTVRKYQHTVTWHCLCCKQGKHVD
jgi:hypothetical protein